MRLWGVGGLSSRRILSMHLRYLWRNLALAPHNWHLTCTGVKLSRHTRLCSTIVANGSRDHTVLVPESRLEELLKAEVAYLETVPIRAVSMQEVLDDLDPRRIADFLKSDNVKRLAFRIRLIETLSCWRSVPELVDMREDLYSWFRSFRLVHKGPDIELKQFTSMIKYMRHEGRDQVLTAAIGMHKLKHVMENKYDDEFLNRWMDAFLMSRIGVACILTTTSLVLPERMEVWAGSSELLIHSVIQQRSAERQPQLSRRYAKTHRVFASGHGGDLYDWGGGSSSWVECSFQLHIKLSAVHDDGIVEEQF